MNMATRRKRTADYLSIGKLCELLQASPATITRAARAAGVQPAMHLNLTPYYHDDDLERIRAKLPGGKRR